MLKQAKRKMQSRRIPLREGNILFDAVSLNAHREIKTGLYMGRKERYAETNKT